MNALRLALSLVAAALLTACGGSQPPIGAPPAIPQNTLHFAAPFFARDRDKARPQKVHEDWLQGGLQKDDLLYVAQSAVKVFTYPQGKLVGGLQQQYSTRGECVDAKGDVFITSTNGQIEEYAHGRIGPIGELEVVRDFPLACAIDPTTGDLAVTGGGNRIDIFRGARGNAIVYKFRLMSSSSFCSYDDKGNLFIVGAHGKHPVLFELPEGSRKLVEIKLDAAITLDSEVQWDGKYLAIGISKLFGAKETEIYRFAIDGSRGTLVGVTKLGSPAYDMYQFLIVGKTLIISNVYITSSETIRDVLFYKYPSGGAPTGSLAKAYGGTFGIAVSRAQK